jgi:sugar phosphate isomerase/epimerase
VDRLGIESLTVFSLPPVDFVHMAADLGCRNIAIGPQSFSSNPEGYPAWSLREPAYLREMKAALRDRGISIALGQGFAIAPGREIRDAAGDLDLMCELGVTRICSVSLDPDLDRTLDQMAVCAEMAGAAGVEVVVEFVPHLVISDLPTALAALRHVGRNNVRVLIDTMHLIRSGGSAADVAALDPDLIGYAQICDAPLVPDIPDYMVEAVTERMVPGEGELPLADIVAALPADVVIGIEIPLLKRAQAGEGPRERTHDCVKGARAVLAAAEAR